MNGVWCDNKESGGKDSCITQWHIVGVRICFLKPIRWSESVFVFSLVLPDSHRVVPRKIQNYLPILNIFVDTAQSPLDSHWSEWLLNWHSRLIFLSLSISILSPYLHIGHGEDMRSISRLLMGKGDTCPTLLPTKMTALMDWMMKMRTGLKTHQGSQKAGCRLSCS